MSKRRVQDSKRKTNRPTLKTSSKKLSSIVKQSRFIGVSISGGKADKSCVAILEFYPDQQKLFLAKLIDKVRVEEHISADLKIHEIITQYRSTAVSVSFDAPLCTPVCLNCKLSCPGYESCDVESIKYIRGLYQQEEDKRKPKKLFTPYTQRALDAYLASRFPEIESQHAFGANYAPLTARAMFMAKRLNIPCIETPVRYAVWQLGQQLKINKTHLLVYRNSIGGEEAREVFINQLADKLKVFFYRQDQRILIENHHAFDAFISAYVGFLHAAGKTENKPIDFPKKELWSTIPK